MPFRPNTACCITLRGTRDKYGQMITGATYEERCAVVELIPRATQTSVRADQSASRGAGEEMVVTAKILLTTTTKATVGCGVTIHGVRMRVLSMFPRTDIRGRLDHYAVECGSWEPIE